MTDHRLPDGRTPLKLLGDLERAIEPLMPQQTFFEACRRMDLVFWPAFNPEAQATYPPPLEVER